MYWCIPFWYFPAEEEPEQEDRSVPLVKTELREMSPEQEEEEEDEKSNEEIFNKYLKAELKKKEENNFRKNWTDEEDGKLLKMREMGQSWEAIAAAIQDGTPVNCQRRHERLMKIVRKWPKQIDQAIIRLYQEEGRDWEYIRRWLQNKVNSDIDYTSKEVRMRYWNYLRAGIDKEKWDFEDDLKLIRLVSEHSRKWKQISPFFPSRSELQVKNRFSRTLQPSIKRVKKKISKMQNKTRIQRS